MGLRLTNKPGMLGHVSSLALHWQEGTWHLCIHNEFSLSCNVQRPSLYCHIFENSFLQNENFPTPLQNLRLLLPWKIYIHWCRKAMGGKFLSSCHVGSCQPYLRILSWQLLCRLQSLWCISEEGTELWNIHTVIYLSFKQYDLRILSKRITCTTINHKRK